MNGQDQKNTKLRVQIYISTVRQNDPFFILSFIHKGNRANAKIIPLALSGCINTYKKKGQVKLFLGLHSNSNCKHYIWGKEKKGASLIEKTKSFTKDLVDRCP